MHIGYTLIEFAQGIANYPSSLSNQPEGHRKLIGPVIVLLYLGYCVCNTFIDNL